MAEKKPKVNNVVWTSLPLEVLSKFDEQCIIEKRKRPQMLRIIVEEYYAKKDKGGKQ
jgi:metal-responsive CopG/Arc/MetJ family transcriptional regulator